MKDVTHHLRHVQKKVIQSTRKEKAQNGKKVTPPLTHIEMERNKELRYSS